MSLILSLSSKTARNEPSGLLKAFLIIPRIPDTVRILAPENNNFTFHKGTAHT